MHRALLAFRCLSRVPLVNVEVIENNKSSILLTTRVINLNS